MEATICRYFRAGFCGLAEGAERQDRIDGERDAIVLEPEGDALRGVACFALHAGAPSVTGRARSAGIVSSPSALSRVMKCSVRAELPERLAHASADSG